MAYTTIKKPSNYFNTVLWTGDGTSSRSITGVGFSPDAVWWKGRTTLFDHRIIDTVRTGTYPKILYPNETSVETEDVNNAESIDSDGFTIGSGNAVNQSGQTYVAWNWLASNTTASNTDGSITSTVSANTTSGFSIVSYTGTGSVATVGHGLGVAPKVIMVKSRSLAVSWLNYHSSLGATNFIQLNNTDSTSASANAWNNTEPTSSVFSLGTFNNVNTSGETYVAYCFAEKQGFSKFGSYTGNGNADGTFVYTGFSPAFIIVKRTDSTNNWLMYDNKRSAFNVTDDYLLADASDAEVTNNSGQALDLLSNGFKIKNSNLGSNASGGSYIYMAFAEEPLVGDNPATAR